MVFQNRLANRAGTADVNHKARSGVKLVETNMAVGLGQFVTTGQFDAVLRETVR